MENYLLISDAAKEVRVESHVLRYWEEELHLPIKRNELGHRYYTKEDVERFRQIKSMKEKGLQLKAIKMILKDGKLSMLPEGEAAGDENRSYGEENIKGSGKTNERVAEEQENMPISIVSTREVKVEMSREEKAQRLQWLLQQMIRETLQENNQELCREIKESIVKELDYQFRNQEEREEERERIKAQRDEAYYQKMDELLRKKSKKALGGLGKKEKKELAKREEVKSVEKNSGGRTNIMDIKAVGKKAKKKRHFVF